MNNKRKLTKSLSVALLVALASFASAGIVLADHFPPVGSVSMSSLTSFEQYQAAIDHAESERQSETVTFSSKAALRSSGTYAPYPDEFDQSELDRRDVTVTTVNRNENFLPYLDESDRMELHWSAAKSRAGDSWSWWEQYFMYAK